MPIETPADRRAMMDVNDFDDTVELADGCTFTAYFHQGYSESLDIPGRRPALLALGVDVVAAAVVVGTSITVAEYDFTVQHIEQGDKFSKLFLETRAL